MLPIAHRQLFEVTASNETITMLVVLALIDVVMVSNLLIMVIVGGYETFVSRMQLENHPDQPEWLGYVNASVLKVKLLTAIIGIGSIHLLKTFINAANYDDKVLMWQTIIHVVFMLSAMAMAISDRFMSLTMFCVTNQLAGYHNAGLQMVGRSHNGPDTSQPVFGSLVHRS